MFVPYWIIFLLFFFLSTGLEAIEKKKKKKQTNSKPLYLLENSLYISNLTNSLALATESLP